MVPVVYRGFFCWFALHGAVVDTKKVGFFGSTGECPVPGVVWPVVITPRSSLPQISMEVTSLVLFLGIVINAQGCTQRNEIFIAGDNIGK